MLLRTFKSNRAVNFILIPLMGGLFWLKELMDPGIYPFFPGEPDNLLYSPLHRFLAEYPIIQVVTVLLLLIGMAVLLIQMNNRYNIIRIRTMLPAPLFILIISGFTFIHAMHPVYFATFFVMVAIYRVFSTFDEVKPYSPAFDSGFFLGVASLFYFNSVVLFPALFIGVAILSRETKWRELVVCFLGFLLPFVFAFSYVYVTDSTSSFLNNIKMSVFTHAPAYLKNDEVLIYSVLLLVITLLASVKILRQYDTKKVSTRKFFIVLFLVFLFAILGFIFLPGASFEIFVLASIPLTFLMANFFVFIKSRFWGEFLFWLLVIAVIILEFFA